MMPYVYSELQVIHDIAVKLFRTTGLPCSLKDEVDHRDVIARFDRHPHCNRILGRKSTEELTSLKRPDIVPMIVAGPHIKS